MRQIGMASGPIPSDKIVWFAERLEMDLLEQEAFEHVIRAVDAAYMKSQAAKAAKRSK